MGFDVSYHPVKETEMRDWFFGINLKEILDNNFTSVQPVIEQFALESFYAEKYIDTLKAAAITTPNEPFENTYGYYMAVIQGFMRKYFYTRGSAFSFLIQDKPYFKEYTKPWKEIVVQEYKNPVYDQIHRNYSSGVYISADKVVKLLHDYNNNNTVRQDLDNFYTDGRIAIFINALEYASSTNDGILEATEVVEPNPLDLDVSACYSNLFNCDIEGAMLYQQAAREQIREIEKRENLPEGEITKNAVYEKSVIEQQPEPEEKKGFFKRLFG